MLTTNLDRKDVNWISKQAAIKLTYNSRASRITGSTPVWTVLGHDIKLSINLRLLEPENPPSEDKWLRNLQENRFAVGAMVQ